MKTNKKKWIQWVLPKLKTSAPTKTMLLRNEKPKYRLGDNIHKTYPKTSLFSEYRLSEF